MNNFLLENKSVQNAYFKVVNENFPTKKEDSQVKLVMEQKRIPAILKKHQLINIKSENIVIPTKSTKGSKIAITPQANIGVSVSQANILSTKTNGYKVEVCYYF